LKVDRTDLGFGCGKIKECMTGLSSRTNGEQKESVHELRMEIRKDKDGRVGDGMRRKEGTEVWNDMREK